MQVDAWESSIRINSGSLRKNCVSFAVNCSKKLGHGNNMGIEQRNATCTRARDAVVVSVQSSFDSCMVYLTFS